MRTLFVFIIFFTLVLVSGATLAYPMHALLAHWFKLDFERVASRCVLILAIILFIALFRKLRFGSWRDIGYSSNLKEFYKDLLKGFFLGIVIMSPVVAGLLATANRVIDLGWGWSFVNISSLLITALLAGLIIALIEETLFRGAMLTAIQRRNSILFAIISTSFVYAFVHFLQPQTYIDPNTLTWSSGFTVLKNAFLPLSQPIHIIDSFIALFLAGLLLAIIKTRTNRLAICIGIHTGWVFSIKTFKRVTNSNIDSDFAYLTGNYDKVIGYLAATCIALVIIIYLRIKNRSQIT